MASLNCCCFRRPISPELLPAVLIDTSQTGGRFALSSHTPSRAESLEDTSVVQPIQELSTSANKSAVAQETVTGSSNDLNLAHEADSEIRHRDSNRRLHDVAIQVRKRMSRDSGMSRRSSTKTKPRSFGDDDHDRREELKRALHQRVQEDIHEDSRISSGSFDDDAVPIKTPKGTLGRHEGSIQISPKHLSNALRRSESPSGHPELEPRNLPPVYGPKNTAVALSRMLVQRGSSLARESEEKAVDSKVENARRASTPQKYNFGDEDSPVRVLKTRSLSLLGRSNTVVRVPSSTKALDVDLKNPEFLDTAGARTTDPPAEFPNKVRDLAVEGGSRLPIADVQQNCSSNGAYDTYRSTLGSRRFPGIYDTKIRPASEQLLHGTSGLWAHPVHCKHSNTDSTTGTNTSSSNGHNCSPESEEMSFGGTDGKDHSPQASEAMAGVFTKQRSCSEGSDPIHLYDMHIPQRLASKPLLPSVSLPQLDHARRDRSYTSGSSSRLFSVIPRSQPSLMSTSEKHFRTPATHLTSSSVYSSGSFPSSPPDSILHPNGLSDRLCYLEILQPNEEAVSARGSRPRSVDLDNLERHTVETSYHSSNESLMERELAAAETRISPLPRANTVSKNSRFREDLDRISAELALTNPPRRRFSNLDGARSPIDEDAASVWERALREHSQEDKAISHTRIGSTSSDLVGPRQLDSRAAASSRKSSSFLSADDRRVPERLEGAHLRAHLSSYTLPPRREKTDKRPTLEGIRKSPSEIRASSWARYPSHSRAERSTSPAGVSDNVYSRDFAITSARTLPEDSSLPGSWPLSNGNREKSKTMTFGQQILSTISGLYKRQSQELQRRLANEARGNRSSVSEGGPVEYPELEMLGSLSPPLPSPDVGTKLELEEHVRIANELQRGTQAQAQTQTPVTTSGRPSTQVSRKQSQDWAREYQDVIQTGAPFFPSGKNLPVHLRVGGDSASSEYPPPTSSAGDHDHGHHDGGTAAVKSLRAPAKGEDGVDGM